MTETTDRAPHEAGTTDPSEAKATLARRTLLGAIGFATLGGIAAGALGLTGRGASPARAAAATSTPTLSPTPRRTATPTATMDHDAHAESVVKAFPAKTEGAGLQPLTSRIVDGAREFELSCEKVRWEVTPGVLVDALSYNGQVPGPIIRVTEGERVRVKVTNKTDQTTGVHWHGQRVVNKMDGVPFITQPVIKPGETFVYDFVAKPFGSHMYHSHHNATEQVGRGMLGPLLVMPKVASVDPAYDKDELFIFNDQLGGLTINGKGFPATVPFTAKLGQRIRFRFMNEGVQIHPAHLHGLTFEVFARDGYPLPQPFRCDTINVAPGERWDAIVLADEPASGPFIATSSATPRDRVGCSAW